MSSLGPGDVIAGRYRLVDLLGKGAMGEVWRAEHTTLGAPVAIKLIDVELLGTGANHENNEIVQRFFREAKAAAALRSPHVVQILDHGYDGNLPYIAMEMLEGETLEHRIDRERRLQPQMTTRVITHVARAIGKAHEAGIVHRDLKPSNVFLVRNDDEEIAKVLDFGIAKATNGGVLGSAGGVATRTGSVVGTPCYMSPEQALGNKTIDHRADLWALGVIAYECVCGQRPFDSEALGDLIVQICARPLPIPSACGPVPDGFDAWFAKACAREPNDRFQNSKELAESLRWVLMPDSSGIFRFNQTHPSLPNVVVPPRTSNPGGEPLPSALAKTTAVDPGTMTHRGLVAAVAQPSAPPKGKRVAMIIGAAVAVVIGGVTIAVLSSSGRSGDPTANTSPSGAAQAQTGASPVPTPTTPAPEPAATPSSVATNTAPEPETTAAGSTAPTASAAPVTTSKGPYTKPPATTSTGGTKKGTTKKPNWGF